MSISARILVRCCAPVLAPARVAVIQRPVLAAAPAMRHLGATPSSSSTSTSSNTTKPAFTNNDMPDMNAEPESIEIDSTIRLKNAALAAVLFTFVFGVASYSMNAVGQSGVSNDTTDPLAVLKQEAAAAQEKRSQQQESDQQQQELLKQFQAGQFDPDELELAELEAAEERGAAQKKPWWKFWARG